MARMIEGQEFLSPSEAAELLDVSARTVQRWLRSPRPREWVAEIVSYEDPLSKRIFISAASVELIRERQCAGIRPLPHPAP